LAFGEDVLPPCSAPFALPVFRRRYHTLSPQRNTALVASGPKSEPAALQGTWLSKQFPASLTIRAPLVVFVLDSVSLFT
jgi:hypothetical protein